MRKFLYMIFAFLFIVIGALEPLFMPCYADTEIYYRVNNASTVLYRTPNITSTDYNTFFTLPNSYFVKQVTEVDELFMKVQFLDFVGYVLKTEVSRVYSTPSTPFASGSLSIKSTANAVMYSEPSTESKYVGAVPFNAESIVFYGAVSGQAVEENVPEWYFCKYTSFEQGVIVGYIYSSLCETLTAPVVNTEEVLTEPTTNTGSNPILAPELATKTSIYLILGLSIPALLLLILLFKPFRKKDKTKVRQVTNLQRIKLNEHNNDELDF